MIRNLKVLIAAAMALAAFAATNVSGAQAAEFHCSVEPCTATINPDGAVPGKTSHHVFIVKKGAESISFTCNQLTGDATSATKTTKTATFGGLSYHHCTGFGQSFNVRMNGCEYHFVTPGITHTVSVQVKCPEGKVIEIEFLPNCLITIGTTAVLEGGIKLHDPETNGVKKTEITAEPTVKNVVPVTVHGNCPIAAGAAIGEYTTGNVEVTGETTSGVHASVWWTA